MGWDGTVLSWSDTRHNADRFCCCLSAPGLPRPFSQLSFAVQRWCNASNLALTNAGIDDNEFQPNNFRLVLAAALCFTGKEERRGGRLQCEGGVGGRGQADQCRVGSVRPAGDVHGRIVRVRRQLLWHGPDLRPYGALQRGAAHAWDADCLSLCVFASVGVVCISNVAPGYNFDPTTATFAGENATTTVCAPGLTGFATRLCQWNGPNSRYGIWAEPVNFCRRMMGLWCARGPSLQD
jgi:hypothetical protein